MTDMFTSFFNPGGAYKKAQEQSDKYYGQAQGFQKPLIDQGQGAYGGLSEALQKLLNPEQLHNEWAQGYEESPYAAQQRYEGEQFGRENANAMGLGLSTPFAKALGAGHQGAINAERGNYLNDLMQKYMTGINLGQNIYGIGANASGQASNLASNMGESSSMNAANQYSAGGRMLGNLIGTGASLAGAALGGPMGGALASKLWSSTGAGGGASGGAGVPYKLGSLGWSGAGG